MLGAVCLVRCAWCCASVVTGTPSGRRPPRWRRSWSSARPHQEVHGDDLARGRLELAPELVEAGRREAVVEPDLGTELRARAGPDLIAGVALGLAVAVLDRVQLLTGHDHVPGGCEVRLQVA